MLIRFLNSIKYIFGCFLVDNCMQQFRDDNNQDTASLTMTQVISLEHQFRFSKKINPSCALTFLPIPLVGEGAGDTGTKSMRFGDEDADFSKSLSLWGHSSTTPVTTLSLHASTVAYQISEHCSIITVDLKISSKHDKKNSAKASISESPIKRHHYESTYGVYNKHWEGWRAEQSG